MTRIRTINGAYKELHAHDPGCEVSQGLIRRLVETGECPSIKSGNRYLIDMDNLEAILSLKQEVLS